MQVRELIDKLYEMPLDADVVWYSALIIIPQEATTTTIDDERILWLEGL